MSVEEKACTIVRVISLKTFVDVLLQAEVLFRIVEISSFLF